jgi:hypothetical protein
LVAALTLISVLDEHTPAQELLSPELSTPPSASSSPVHHRVLPDNLIVYTRTTRRQDDAPAPAAEFLGKVYKKIDALVPTPTIQKRRKKTMGPVSMPRRS